MPRQVVIVGAGIVGSSLAAELGGRDGLDVTVLEQGPADRLVGATGHAPGFVGLLNESAVGTALAVASAERYEAMELMGVPGFDRVGALEIATGQAGLARLVERAALARARGLPAEVLGAADAVSRAPELIDAASCAGGVFYPRDGTARAPVITAVARHRAAAAGVRFVFGCPVLEVLRDGGRASGVRTGAGALPADDVVLAGGSWSPALRGAFDEPLPVVPVAHPYVHGEEGTISPGPHPFVRWPEQHVYARAHGDRLGLGTYDHHLAPPRGQRR